MDTPLDPSNAKRYAYADDPINNADQRGRISVDIFVKLVHAFFTGESLLNVLSTESLAAYASSFVFEAACDSAVGTLTLGVRLIIGALGCGVLADDLAEGVDEVIKDN